MNKHIVSISIAIIMFSGLCSGDIFKHRVSGEVFYGYPTNRSQGSKTYVYVHKEGKFSKKKLLINEYEITYDPKGRKENLIVIGIDHQDILLSDTVSKSLAKTIIEGANKGPRCIILEIDAPGGRGECMKKVCDAIKKTSNCPVIAFISGVKYGGAYSAAAGVALACDKIYIAPNAQIGTLCPQIDTFESEQNAADWQAMFVPESIASFGGYLASIARSKNRPAAMAMALIDRSIEVVEVVTDKHGSRNIVHKAEKQAKDAIVRTWSKTIKIKGLKKDLKDEYDTSEQTESQITLSAEEAIYTSMADAVLSSRIEVIEDIGADDIKVLSTTRIKAQVRKFAQSRAVIHRHYQAIPRLEKEAEEIEKELKDIISKGRRHMPTREENRLNRLRQDVYDDRLNNNSGNRRNFDNTNNRNRNSKSMNRNNNTRRNARDQDTYINPYLFEQQRLARELALVLDELIDSYVSVNKLARQFPRALPEGKTLRDLQQRYNIALSTRNSLGY